MTKRQQLFTDIAEGFDKLPGDRPPRCTTGICWAIFEDAWDHNTPTEDRICDTFHKWKDKTDPRSGYWWCLGGAGDQQRVLFSLFMAAMSDEDFYAVEEA